MFYLASDTTCPVIQAVLFCDHTVAGRKTCSPWNTHLDRTKVSLLTGVFIYLFFVLHTCVVVNMRKSGPKQIVCKTRLHLLTVYLLSGVHCISYYYVIDYNLSRGSKKCFKG